MQVQILNGWEQEPVGRGTPQLLTQGNLPVLYGGDHLSNDLLWVGRFPAAGTYWVKAKNDNAYPHTLTLFVEGTALH